MLVEATAAFSIAGPAAAPEPAAPRRAARFDPFHALSRPDRVRERHAYHAHLRRTDGEIDRAGWRLPRRAERVVRLRERALAWRGRLDVDAFYQLVHRVGRPATDARTHWAALVAIANESERYGVELESAELRRRGAQADPIQIYHVLQEDHHTSLLLEACRTLGLGGFRMAEPRRLHRWVIRAMTRLPDALRYALILLGEAMGCVVMQMLHDTSHLFSDTPEIEAHLRSLLAEIVDDERLHAAHCRTRLGPAALALVRALLPLTARVTVLAYPQIRRLGLDHRMLVERIRAGIEVPGGVDWIRTDPLAGSA